MSEKQTLDNHADSKQHSAAEQSAVSLDTTATETVSEAKEKQSSSATDSAKTTKTASNAKKAAVKPVTKPESKQPTDDEKTTSAAREKPHSATTATPPTKSGGKGLSLFAILIALGVGAGGYFWGNQQLSALQQQVGTLSAELAKLQAQPSTSAVQPVMQDNSEAVKTALQSQFAELQTAQANARQQTQREIQQLSAALDLQKTENSELRNQLNKLSFNNKTEANDWLMSEADFLLTNAQRKLVLDNDIDTVVLLLQEANQTLQQVSTSQALSIRTAISNDLAQLQTVNDVDQDLIMSQLSLLVSQVDNLKVLALNPANKANTEVSDSIDDWQQNLEKSASSFLSHFIQVRKKDPNRPEFLAPDQDIFLKENIRLSLQVALIAVPRQQNEVYKQSLNSVASWIRSYFDTDDFSVQQFLQQVDQLKEQSIYVNAPQQLSAWQAIGTVLNRDYRTLGQFSNTKAQEKSAAESPKKVTDSTPEPAVNTEEDGDKKAQSPAESEQTNTPAATTRQESRANETAGDTAAANDHSPSAPENEAAPSVPAAPAQETSAQ
ncbi:uroporphyrinogen-III C-methyltransferase [Testudinibacter sp. P80/BLE/0925]|uniref:uroporphyrinogen-III C-methyltransferase n=1 Tax=Testudinibacter sp. TW-1 TaxID=3417757 RepID=UPI003D36D03E